MSTEIQEASSGEGQPLNSDSKKLDRLARLSLREKLGYGLGDAGLNFYWATIVAFLAAFYTDVFGISAKAAATMFLITKIFDACTDPVMGAIADRTQSRFGKFRPYLLFAGLPMAGAAVLTFTTPELNQSGKLVWAYGTYTLMMMMYTVLATPYASLSGVLTARSQDRTAAISFRFVLASFVMFFVNAYTLDLVAWFGGVDEAKGWQYTMILYGLVAATIFAITFALTKERIAPPPSQNSTPLLDIKDLLHNNAWLILFVISMVVSLAMAMRSGSAYYYFHYFFNRPDLLGAYLGCQALAFLFGALITPLLTIFLPKARLLALLYLIFAILSIGFAFVPKPDVNGMVTVKAGQVQTLYARDLLGQVPANASFQWQKKEYQWWISSHQVDIAGASSESINIDSEKGLVISVKAISPDDSSTVLADSSTWPGPIILAFILNLVICLVLGPKAPLIWSMYADTADYNEWRTGRRATAMTFSAATFSQKMGGALGAAGMLWLLGALGYVAKVEQSGASQFGIVLLQTAIPGVFGLIAAIVVTCYTLTGSKLEEIQLELNSRSDNR